MRRLVVVTLLTAPAHGCTASDPGDAPPPGPSPKPTPPAKGDPAPAPPTPPAGPSADSGASKEQRSDAVLAVLSGKASADQLPVLATDPNQDFDPRLAETLVPRIEAIARVRQGKAEVEGDLDGDIIRRIVRAHISEVRSCYEQGLADQPKLKGEVVIGFEISADGKIGTSKVAESTLEEKSVGECMATVAASWKFPKPRDGKPVRVAYPFVLSPG